MEIDRELQASIPFCVRRRKFLVILVAERVVDKTVVSFISTNHQKGIAKGGIFGKSPVGLGDVSGGRIVEKTVVNAVDHFRVGVHGVLLQEADQAMGCTGSKNVHEGEESDKTDLAESNEELLHTRQRGVCSDGEQVHALVLSLVHEGLDPLVGLKTTQTAQMVKVTAHQSGNRRHAFQEDSAFDVVFLEVHVSDLEENVDDARGDMIAHSLGLSLGLLTPALLKDLEVLTIATVILPISLPKSITVANVPECCTHGTHCSASSSSDDRGSHY